MNVMGLQCFGRLPDLASCSPVEPLPSQTKELD